MQIEGGKVETVTGFIFLGSEVTADGDYRYASKRYLLLGRRADKPREHIKKKRHHFANKGPYSQSYVFFFPVIMYGCESWTTKKAEWWRIDAFKLCCWRRLLYCKEIKLVNPTGNQHWIFIGRINAEAEVPVLGPSDAESAHWKTLILGKIAGKRRE